MKNNKYIIRNCPAYFYDEINGEQKCWQLWEQHDETCQNCIDCVMKQIVEKCKEHHSDLHFTPSEILALIDIQEVE